jgi:hypothetical protein
MQVFRLKQGMEVTYLGSTITPPMTASGISVDFVVPTFTHPKDCVQGTTQVIVSN